MKIVQMYTPEDFKALNKDQMFDLWFRQALSDKKIAKLYGVTPQDVKDKVKSFNMTLLNCAIAALNGPKRYRFGTPILIATKPGMKVPGDIRKKPDDSELDNL